MALQHQLEQSQKLAMTQAMQQSLQCLQIPLGELLGFLQENFLSNPFLEVEAPSVKPLSAETDAKNAEFSSLRESSDWRVPAVRGDFPLDVYSSKPKSYTDYLNDQLGQMAALDKNTLSLCRYLVYCLSSSGYLDCSLEELAEELSVPLFEMEQALFIVQSLDPPGTAARNLSECLILQLSQSEHFCAATIRLVKDGLSLLSENDYPGLARLLNVSLAEARKAADIVRSLNPVPSQGFYTYETSNYVVPEAVIHNENDRIIVEFNNAAFPRVELNPYYCSLLNDANYTEDQAYLKEHLAKANAVISSLEARNRTIQQLLLVVTDLQREFFLHDKPLQPMTMQQVAERMGLNVSTISRAVKDKYIQFNGKMLPIKSLFSHSLPAATGSTISAEAIRHQLKAMIAAESPEHPLSDMALCEALASTGAVISRRTVAKYREQLQIPSAAIRKREKKRG